MSILADRLARFPRLGLAQLPTPLEPLTRLTAHLDGPRIWIKRDDATGLGLGGNKLRKLDVAPPTEAYERSGNALLNRLFGAQLHDVPWTGDRNTAIENLAAQLRGQGRRVFVVPYGVSSPLGAVGYASTVAEIAEQSRLAAFDPAAIIHSTGSGGTQAGLVAGASIALRQTAIVGIDVDAEPARVRAEVMKCAKAAADLLGTAIPESAIEVVAGHAGPAYGVRIPPPSTRSGWRARSKGWCWTLSIPARVWRG